MKNNGQEKSLNAFIPLVYFLVGVLLKENGDTNSEKCISEFCSQTREADFASRKQGDAKSAVSVRPYGRCCETALICLL